MMSPVIHKRSAFATFARPNPWRHGDGSSSLAEALVMMPMDAILMPDVFSKGFGVPRASADWAVDAYEPNTSAAIPQAFRLPYPVLDNRVVATSERATGAGLGPGSAAAGQCAGSLGRASSHLATNPLQAWQAINSYKQDASVQPHLDLTTPLNLPVEQTAVNDASGKAVHKSRVVWTEELHQRFLMAIDAAGEDAAVPTVILKLMNVNGLSRDNVASHLQKHRLGLKRGRARKRRNVDDVTAARPKMTRRNPPRGPSDGGTDACTLSQACDELGASITPTPGASQLEAAVANEDAAWLDQEGSNDREGLSPLVSENEQDREDLNPASDDGGGAGSDNRNSACNVSELQLQPGSYWQPNNGESHRTLHTGLLDGEGGPTLNSTPPRSDEEEGSGQKALEDADRMQGSRGGSNDQSKRGSMLLSTGVASNVGSGATAGSGNARAFGQQLAGTLQGSVSPAPVAQYSSVASPQLPDRILRMP